MIYRYYEFKNLRLVKKIIAEDEEFKNEEKLILLNLLHKNNIIDLKNLNSKYPIKLVSNIILYLENRLVKILPATMWFSYNEKRSLWSDDDELSHSTDHSEIYEHTVMSLPSKFESIYEYS